MKTRDEVVAEIRADLELQAEIDGVEDTVMNKTTLADLLRGGSKHTVQVTDWGAGENACALSAAAYAAQAAGLIKDRL